jgi:hypothetical protein
MSEDITAEQLLELLADDEMIESGYDREGMVALLLLARAALQAQARELAELRTMLGGRLTVWASWRDSGELPDDHGLSDPDGDPIDVDLDASGLIEEVRRRQAKAVIRRHELSDPLGPELGAVLALVPSLRWLAVDPLANGRCVAWWRDEENQLLAHASGDTYEAAILAATAKLLGLDEGSLRRRVAGSPDAVVKAAMAPPQDDVDYPEERTGQALIDAVEQLRGATAEPRPRSCRSCVHFERDAAPAVSGDGSARPCIARNGLLVHPESGDCEEYAPDTDPAPQLPGVTEETASG